MITRERTLNDLKFMVYILHHKCIDMIISLLVFEFHVDGAAIENGRKPSIWDTFAYAGGCLLSPHEHRPNCQS